MLTRSKIKLEQSIRQVQPDAPYFNNQQQRVPAHMYKQRTSQNYSKVNTNQYSDIGLQQNIYRQQSYDYNLDQNSRRNIPNRNQILKELRQQYQILKNLQIQDSIHVHVRKYEGHEKGRLSESSELSSSMHSKRSHKNKQSELRIPKQSSKDIQSLHIEKKQLQIVIGNSMRKIEQLLNNQILLKKTIHQLKNQIEGKGGVHQQYEKLIKGLQKNEEELQQELNKSKLQNEKNVQRMKQLNDKIRYFEIQLGNRQRQIKQGFQEQKKLHELIRIEKDRYLNLQIQCKTYKMEYDLLEKQKDNELKRLIRQFQSKEGGNQKQMSYAIRKLEQEIREKDKRYHQLLIQKEEKKKTRQSQVVPIEKKNQKNYLEQLLYKSREMNEYNSKALGDSMNLIFAKMTEIQKKNDQTLKKEIESLKKKSQEGKKNTNEADLLARVVELQKMIEKEISEKTRLSDDIKNLKSHKYELQDKNKSIQKKLKDLEQRQLDLKDQIKQLQNIKSHFNSTYTEHHKLKEQLNSYILKTKQYQSEKAGHYDSLQNIGLSFKDKEKRYEDQIRILRRKIDQAQFSTEKAVKEGQFNINIIKTQHEAEAKRIVAENSRLTLRIKELQTEIANLKNDSDNKLKARELEVNNLKNVFQALRIKSQQDLNNQKKFYDESYETLNKKHSLEIQNFNNKFLSISASHEKLLTQISTYSSMQSQLFELRKVLRQSRSFQVGVNHLWEIKQTEYNNINDILKSVQN